jgi:YD repeat-containing protein
MQVISLFGMNLPLETEAPPEQPPTEPGSTQSHSSSRYPVPPTPHPVYHYDDRGNLTQVCYADGACQTFAYDDRNNLIRQQTATGISRDFTYDDCDRLCAISDNQGYTATYESNFDSVRFANPVGATVIRYDDRARPVSLQQTVQSTTLETQYTYNAAGHCTGVRFPGSSQWLYSNFDDRTDTVQLCAENGVCYATFSQKTGNQQTDNQQTSFNLAEAQDLTGFLFNQKPEEKPSSSSQIITYANGVREARITDTDAQIKWIEVTPINGIKANLRYQFNQQSQIEQIGTNQFQYDREGRLTIIQANAQSTHYTYSIHHNRSTTETTAGTTRYEYDDCDRLLTLIPPQAPKIEYDYDRDGNRIRKRCGDRLTDYRYNSNGQLAEIWQEGACLVQYAYDALGKRVQRIAGDTVTLYFYDLNGQLLAETDENGQVRVTYLWVGLRCLGRIHGPVGAAATEFYHTDHLGSAWAISDIHGTLIRQQPVHPFGEDYSPLFARKFRDPLTGFYDFGARDYDSESGCFLTPDSYTFAPDDWRLLLNQRRNVWGDRPSSQAILDRWQEQPQLRNRYTFCLNDPVNHIDLDGHSAWWFFLTIPTSLTWATPNTALAMVLVVGNLLLELLGWVLLPFMWIANKSVALEHYPWGKRQPANPFNLKERAHFWLGLDASARLGVPWTILNGSFFVWRPFTLGNVVFIQDSDDNGHEGDTTSRFVVPKDIDVQLNRQDALHQHEMQHVFQYNMLGPIFLIAYLISLIKSQSNSYFERNSGANSGDVYQTVLEAEEKTVYVGEFTRIVCADKVFAPSPTGPTTPTAITFTISPAVTVGPATSGGSLNPGSSPHQIKLDARNTLPVRVVNGSGFYFHSLQAGKFTVSGKGSLSSVTETVEIEVKEVEVKFKASVFICEKQTIEVGNSRAIYSLRAKTMNSGGTVTGLIYTAGNTRGTDTIEVLAKYDPNHPVFKQYGDNGLAGHQYVVKTIDIQVQEPTITPDATEVFVGGLVTFTMNQLPQSGTVNAPPTVPGSQFNLSKRQFIAGKGPIAADATEVVSLNYGCKTYPFSIKVKPFTATIAPSTVDGGGSAQITVTGGVPPYRYTVSVANSKGGTVDSSGKYTAGSADLQVIDTITITDRNGDGGRARVQITVNPMTIRAEAASVSLRTKTKVIAEKGVSPYTYSITNRESTGSTIDSQGQYTAGTTPGSDTITATDKQGTRLTVVIAVTP